MRPRPYDGTPEGQRAHARFLRALAEATVVEALAPRPTAAQLERHAQKFGPAHVAETAAEVGVDVDVSGIPEPRRPRRRKR